MAQTVCILLGDEDRKQLAAIIGDRNRPQKHVQRARIVHLSAERLSVLAVARQTGASRPAVWRWQQRFAEEGVEGLLRDKTRIADNYATHKHPKVKPWLASHPRWVFHFTPTSASWLNAVEGFFSTITRRHIRRGVFKSVADLEQAIRRYISEHNRSSC